MAKVITVTSFESPHCFWIIEKDDEAKRNQLQTLINKQSVKNLQPATTIPETVPFPCIEIKTDMFTSMILDMHRLPQISIQTRRFKERKV